MDFDPYAGESKYQVRTTSVRVPKHGVITVAKYCILIFAGLYTLS